MTSKLRAFAVLSIFLAVTGCASSRSVVALSPQVKAENPHTGPAVAIIKVEDARVFESKPKTANIPSLKDGKIYDVATTSRAIGRKRNGYGKAMGDILLPENETVTSMVTNAVATGYRRAGYRVLTSADPGFAQATPVTVRINKFWCWIQPGFWAIKIDNESEIIVTSQTAGFQNGVPIKTASSKGMQLVVESDWTKSATEMLNDMSTNLAVALSKNSSAAK